jgi:membrane-associated phospholipid phosphatase
MTSVTIPLIALCVWPFVSLFLNLMFVNLTSSSSLSQRPKKLHRIKSSSCDNLITNNTTTMRLTRFVFAFYESLINVSGLLLSIGITEGITQCMKMFIGRLRPNMYHLCEFDINTLHYSSTVLKTQIREGHLSFPSGHSSLASVSMMYCTWYLLYYYSPNRGLTTKSILTPSKQYSSIRHNKCLLLSLFRTLLVVSLLPGYAVYVGMTRIVDHWHHVSDVLAGICLGFSIGTIVFHIIVHPLHNDVIRTVTVGSNETKIESTMSSIQPSNLPTTFSTNTYAADRV